MKLDADEKELLESVDRGEWKSSGGGNARAQLATRATERCLATGNRVLESGRSSLTRKNKTKGLDAAL